LKEIDRWTLGNFQLHLQESDPHVQARYVKVRAFLRRKLGEYQTKHADKWEDLLDNIRKASWTTKVYVPSNKLHRVLAL
jgi:hypothetical protein